MLQQSWLRDVATILAEGCCTNSGRGMLQQYWPRDVARILAEVCCTSSGRGMLQQYWLRDVAAILTMGCCYQYSVAKTTYFARYSFMICSCTALFLAEA